MLRRSMMTGAMLGGLAACLVWAAAVPQHSGQAKINSADRQFMMKAAQGGMMEVDLGRMATRKAANSAVKDFGQRMVDDHSKANNELKSLAKEKAVTLPTTMDAKGKAMVKHLSGLSGAAFDRAYMQHMVADHKHDVAEFRKEAKSGHDADVRRWAGKTLPTLEQHMSMATRTASLVTMKAHRSPSSQVHKR